MKSRPLSPMRFEGTIKTWNDERGFGFIEPALGGEDIFVHIKAFQNRSARPAVGQFVSFAVELSPEGKKRACAVKSGAAARLRARPRNDQPAQWGTASYFAIPAFLILYVIVGIAWRPPAWSAGIYLGVSALTFVVYGADKSAAVAGEQRIPESTLHLLGLLGGWPGAIVAQQFLRHKSNKAEFRAAFWGSVVGNALGFVVLASPLVRQLLAG